jgi:hypothetical protein
MTTAREEILSTYDRTQLHDIAEHGCISGCASAHIYYKDTIDFFNKYDEEIQDDLMARYGEDFLALFARDVQDHATMQNNMVWDFIESVACSAQQYITA